MTRYFLSGLVLIAASAQAQELDARRGLILDQAAYLRHLEDTKNILKIESEIAALREQCRRQGFICSGAGGGVVEIGATPAAPAPETPQAPAPLEPVQELTLMGIAGGRARIASRTAGLSELVEGRAIHGWQIEKIELDRVHLRQGARRHTLHLNWAPAEPAQAGEGA